MNPIVNLWFELAGCNMYIHFSIFVFNKSAGSPGIEYFMFALADRYHVKITMEDRQ